MLDNDYGSDSPRSETDQEEIQNVNGEGSRGSFPNSIESEEEEYAGGCFEGPEKTLEVVFRNGKGAPNGLRSFDRDQLDHLCTLAKCSILSSISNNHMDAYVLSESSLFVYKYRYIMKTCGTTTLLRCLKTLLKYADDIGMELTWVGYSRKNLQFPNAQLWPHLNFGEEIKYISSHGNLQDRLRGSGHILGPVTGDHWFVYVADLFPVPEEIIRRTHEKIAASKSTVCSTEYPLSLYALDSSTASSLSCNELIADNPPSLERTVNMMMFDMAPEVSEIFYKKNCSTGQEMTMRSGINTLCPGATIDETAFSPCGYSMNAILHDAYFTIHITPEPQCSYVSFETNTCLKSYDALVRNVLSIFRPKRFLLTMFGDDAAFSSIPELPTDPREILLPGLGNYHRTSFSSTKVDAELGCQMANYSLERGVSLVSNKKPSSTDLVLLANSTASFNRERSLSLV